MARRKQILPDDDIARIISDDVIWSSRFRTDYETKWLRFFTLYKNYIDKATYPFEANLAIPTAFTIVAVQKAFLLDMLFEGGSFVEVLGKTPEGQAQAKAVRELLDYHFRNSFEIFEDMDKYMTQLLMYGTSIYKVFWKYEQGFKTRNVPVYDDEGVMTGYRGVLNAEIMENKPSGYTVDLFNFGVDPNATSIADARYVYEDMWLDPIKLRELEQQNIGFRNIDEAVRTASNTNRGMTDRFNEINIPAYQTPSDDANGMERRGKVHVVDYWGYLVKGQKHGEVEKSAYEQLYHVMAALPGSMGIGNNNTGYNDPIIIFAEPSPFHHNRMPFVDSRINATIGEFYGTGDLEYCESLLHEQRDIRNVELDNLTMTINKMFKVNRAGGVDTSELVWRPGGIVHVNHPDDVTVLESAHIPPESFRAQEDIRRDVELVTGVSDFTVGQYRSSTGFNDTATGISLIQEVALKRIGHKGQVCQRAVRNIAQIVFSLIGQYMPWDQTVRVLDRQSATQIRFLDVSADALQHMYDFHIVNTPSLGGKPQRINQMLQLYQLASQTKQIDQNFTFDFNLFTRRVIDEMDVPNSEEFFGFENFQRPLPEGLGAPAPEQLIPPDEENAIMISRQEWVTPKMEENHPHHMIVHLEAYDNLEPTHPARSLLQKHYEAHANMKQQTRDIMAEAIATQAAVTGTQVAQGQLEAKQAGGGSPQRQKLGKTTGGNTKSPTGAGGMEDITRAMGLMMGGNAGR